MTSREALEKVIEDISLEWGYEGIEDELREKLKPLYEDLDRLEKLEKENQELKNKNSALELWDKCYTKENSKLKKAIEIIRDKNVNIVYIKIFKDYKLYSQYYTGSSKDILTNEEYELLKEVLECQKD